MLLRTDTNKKTCNFKSKNSTRFYHYYWDMDTYFNL